MQSVKKILIVDDEPEILSLLEEYFASEGYQAFGVRSADEALELLKQQDFPLIFLDLNLPGLSGIELCKIIREERRTPVIHALTGYTSDQGLVECRAAGFDDFFTKPVGLQVLSKAAGDAFERIGRWNFTENERTRLHIEDLPRI